MHLVTIVLAFCLFCYAPGTKSRFPSRVECRRACRKLRRTRQKESSQHAERSRELRTKACRFPTSLSLTRATRSSKLLQIEISTTTATTRKFCNSFLHRQRLSPKACTKALFHSLVKAHRLSRALANNAQLRIRGIKQWCRIPM